MFEGSDEEIKRVITSDFVENVLRSLSFKKYGNWLAVYSFMRSVFIFCPCFC